MRIHSFGVLDAKRSDESLLVWFEWFPLIASFWQSGRVYATNAYVRPRTPTGFSYQATTGGQSGDDEPAWPAVVDQTVTDGSVTWTCKAAASNGVTTPSSPVVAVSPAGLTLGSPTLIDGEAPSSRAQTLVSGGTNGARYSVTCQVTVGTETLKGTLIVPVDDNV